MSIFTTILVFPFVILAAVIWAFLGLFFWVPLISKSVMIFTASVLTQAIVDRPATTAVNNLEKAIWYYPKGFFIIFRTLDIAQIDAHSSTEDESPFELFSSLAKNLFKIGEMFLFALIFWAMLFFFLHHLGVVNVGFVERAEKYIFSGKKENWPSAMNFGTGPKTATVPSVDPPSGGRLPKIPPSGQPETTAAASPTAGWPPLLPTEIDGLRAHIQQCWNPPAGAANFQQPTVQVHLRLKRDGSLDADPIILNAESNSAVLALGETAIRAVRRCQPYRLPPEKYEAWRSIQITFDPRTMTTGKSTESTSSIAVPKEAQKRPLTAPEVERALERGTGGLY